MSIEQRRQHLVGLLSGTRHSQGLADVFRAAFVSHGSMQIELARTLFGEAGAWAAAHVGRKFLEDFDRGPRQALRALHELVVLELAELPAPELGSGAELARKLVQKAGRLWSGKS